MKKILTIALGLTFTLFCNAQNDDLTDSQKRLNSFTTIKKHELSLDVVAAIAGWGINPRYEYVLGRYSGVGVDLNIGIQDNDDSVDFMETFSITPYYRQYFFSKEDYGAKGFYGEGFLKVHSYEDQFFNFNNGNGISQEETFTDVALGIGIGWKWVSDSGFLIDLNLGVGRNLGLPNEPENYSLPEVVGRGGLNFGWRF